jgi:hypothetical protein
LALFAGFQALVIEEEQQLERLRWVLTVAFATAKQASVDTDLTSVLLMTDFTRFKFNICNDGAYL